MTQDDLALGVTGLRPGETSLFQSLGTDPESATIPDEDLQSVALAVAEQEQVPAQRLTRQSIPNQTVQPFEPLAHVGDPSGQIDPCGSAQPKTRFVLLQRFPDRQLHRHQTTSRGSWLTASLPTPLSKMAIQCAEAQT